MYKSRITKKQLTMDDFYQVIPWSQLRSAMYKKDFVKFIKWMRGQTCTPDGIYGCDLERFLKNKPIID